MADETEEVTSPLREPAPRLEVVRLGTIFRPVVRFIASVMITSGLLLLADAGLTLAWQEPGSAFVAGRDQAALEDELEEAKRLLEADKQKLAPLSELARPLASLARLQDRRTDEGDPIGRIELPTLDRSYVVVEGDETDDLRKGPGHFPDTPLPGQRGTVGIAGHRTTYGAPFRTIDKLRRGDPIVVVMPYARFTYRVERTRIVNPKALWVTRRVGHDRLILSACNPLYSAKERIVVFAREVSATGF